MKTFLYRLFRFSLIGLIPLLIILCLYIIFDPFKVLRNYDSYIDKNAKGAVVLNRDHVSTTTFINNNPKYKYNSFIFGNSRSIFYHISEWKTYLNADASCYHFDASAEALYAINKKIEFIDKNGNEINNILLILDHSTLNQDQPKSGHLFIISPPLVDNSNIFEFHKTFFLTFLNPKFLYAFLDFKISGYIKPYMKRNNLLDDRLKKYDAATNEIRYDYFEDLIRANKYYTIERLSVFYKRDTTSQKYSPQCIFENQKRMLENINSITKKHNTSIKIVINPLYDQLQLNNDDLKYLRNLFGTENVFDFSGINKFTNDYRNYYESSHYRPHVATNILEIIYK